MLDKATRALINSARTLGERAFSVRLSEGEMLRICAVIAADLGQALLMSDIADLTDVANSYYTMPLTWFKLPTGDVGFEARFVHLLDMIPDFPTYFRLLCEIHKRRLKYQMILSHQSVPHLETVVPRSLLEYGLHPAEGIASWLVWRKWLYDIDNRAAQETGYLFEPILAAAIGGVPYSASRSPIKRTGMPTQGRQVDCIDGDIAYEFKMRVTIAASGQGRFAEELRFAEDCHNSGYVPTLLVLDPTPSARLDELSSAYRKYGGTALIGDEAWQHLEQKAGETMGRFIETYVRQPLRAVDTSMTTLQPLHLVADDNSIQIHIGAYSFSIARSQSGQIDDADTQSEDEGE
jgi:hypothetical protein